MALFRKSIELQYGTSKLWRNHEHVHITEEKRLFYRRGKARDCSKQKVHRRKLGLPCVMAAQWLSCSSVWLAGLLPGCGQGWQKCFPPPTSSKVTKIVWVARYPCLPSWEVCNWPGGVGMQAYSAGLPTNIPEAYLYQFSHQAFVFQIWIDSSPVCSKQNFECFLVSLCLPFLPIHILETTLTL